MRRELAERELDAYLVVNRNDQYWLTGFTGEDGAVLVTQREVVLLTDGRFDENADREAPWATKVLRAKRTPEVTAREIRRRRLKRIGIDPYHMDVATHAALSKELRPARLVSVSRLIGTMRLTKSAEEVARIREALRVAEAGFKELVRSVRPGQTESEIAARLVYEMQRRGASSPAFEPIVAAGENGSLPHYTAGARKWTRKDALLVDWGARCGWYVSDLTRTILPSSIPRELGRIYSVVREAHERAVAAVRPGAKASEVDRVARDVISRAGYGERFNHALGHGIGLDVHEAPRLGKESADVLKPGMVVTIEPGVYVPGFGGVRIEDDVLVTESGHEVLSSLPVDIA